MLAAWPRWLGRFWFETTVKFGGDTVVHTTAVRWLRISLMDSTETITLDADGRAFTMRGAQRVMGSPRTLSGHGTIDPTAQHAEYTFLWLGTTLRQTAVREDNRVTVTQKGPGFEGTQALIRQR